AWEWWGGQGFQLAKTGLYGCHVSSFYPLIGLGREFDATLDDAAGGTNVDLPINAQITDEGLIAGAVTAAFLLPVAVLGGAVSYSEYETDARNLVLAFWQYLSPTAARVPKSMTPAVPAPCKGCGAALLPDWKVCPHCGQHPVLLGVGGRAGDIR